MTPRARNRAIALVAGLALCALASLAFVHLATRALVGELVFERVEDIAPREVAVVLASGARPTRPSDAAVARLTAAVELLRSGGVQKLLLSGQAFEVEAMRRFLAERQVPASAMILDDASDRTYDTCARLKYVYGLSSVVLVSQAEHVVRAVFTCRELGVPAVGLIAAAFDGAAFWRYRAHELGALPLAWWDVNVRQH